MSERHTRRLKEVKLLSRLKRQEKPKSSKWWSDPPKLIPILISVIALAISFLSLWVSNQGVRINAEINRPVLSLTSLQLISLVPTKSSEHNLLVRSRFKNIGKSSAALKEVEVKAGLFLRDSDKCNPSAGTDSYFSEPVVLPGNEIESLVSITMLPECLPQEGFFFSLFVSANYNDVGSALSYTQDFSEHRRLSREELEGGRIEFLPTPTPSPTATPNPSPTPSTTLSPTVDK